MSIVIREIPLDLVWQVRRDVMYPSMSIEAMQLPDDATGLHLGLFNEEELCSVISLFMRAESMQFRKFATLPHCQGKGYGTQLLTHIFDMAKEKGVQRIWCNARTSATKMYRRFGMLPFETPWEENGHQFIKMQVYL